MHLSVLEELTVLGTYVNIIGIILGTLLGLFAKDFLTDKIKNTLEISLGFCVFLIGIKMGLKYHNVFCLISAIALGGVIGTALKIEDKFKAAGEFLKKRVGRFGKGDFANGFSAASILYTSGAMAIVGSINSGLLGDHELLYTKAILDAIISISFASIYGIGVAFSAIPVFIYQGSLTLGASFLDVLTVPETISDISGVGGILVMMIGVNMLGLKKIPVGDFLPAMILVILLHAFT